MTTESPIPAMSLPELDAMPPRMNANQMAKVLGYSLNRFYKLERTGSFTHLEERPQLSDRRMWLRELVRLHLQGHVITGADRRSVMRLLQVGPKVA